jgi:hypothetical protein
VESGEARAASDVRDVAWAREEQLGQYSLTPTATRVIQRAFAMWRALGSKALPPHGGAEKGM